MGLSYWSYNAISDRCKDIRWLSSRRRNTTDKVKRLLSLMEKTRLIIREAKGPASRLDIPRLFEQPYVRPKNLLSDRIKSINTAKKYLSELESLGLLSHEKMGNEHIWNNTELMEILGD